MRDECDGEKEAEDVARCFVVGRHSVVVEQLLAYLSHSVFGVEKVPIYLLFACDCMPPKIETTKAAS